MRIGINVPNSLLQQVKEINPPVNVSDVCRKALEGYVNLEQRTAAQVHSDNMEAKITHLFQKTSLPAEPDWVGLALDNAANWVRNVTPEEWNDFVEDVDRLRQEGQPEDLYINVWTIQYGGKGIFGHVHDYWDRLTKAARPSRVSGLARDASERGRREYTRAWLGYVYEVRRLIEQRRKEAYERLRAKYDAAFRARLEPEVPEHLL